MKTSAQGRAAIAQREGNKLTAYKDSVGILTIGVGHTSAAGPPKVTAGMKITAAFSDEILSRDLAKFESAVNGAVKVPLSQNQFDALVSLAFNIGGGAFAKSTLVKKLNKKDYGGAAAAFMSWDKAGGKKLPGLTTRRNAERKQFLATYTPASAHLVDPAPKPMQSDPIVPAAVPVAPATPKEVIAGVQRRLTELGYNPGGIDGIPGPLTKGALMSFKNDNGLTPNDIIDDKLQLALAAATPRVMVAARANATVAEVAAKVPEANAHWWNKYIAAGMGAPALIAGGADFIAPAKGYIDPLREMAADVPGYVWLGAVGGIAIALFLIARRGEAKSVEAFQTGDRR